MKTESFKKENIVKENAAKEQRYLISETARLVGVESHVLRYWEEELKLPIRRNELGHRYYTSEDVEQFREIKKLKEQGLQLKAIRTVLTDSRMQVIVPLRERENRHEEPLRAEIFTPVLGTQSTGASEEDAVAVSAVGTEHTALETDDKGLRLQMLLHNLISQAVRENNEELTREIKETIMKEMDYQFRVQEEENRKRDQERTEKDEEHYRRLDELLREYSGRGGKKGVVKRGKAMGRGKTVGEAETTERAMAIERAQAKEQVQARTEQEEKRAEERGQAESQVETASKAQTEPQKKLWFMGGRKKKEQAQSGKR